MDKQRDTSMVSIDTEAFDIVLEVYYWSHKLIDGVMTKDKKEVLACVPMFRDWEDEDSQLSNVLSLRHELINLYKNHPDGDVCVSLTIKEEFVNQ